MFPANPDERYVAAADGVAPLSEGTRAWLGAAYAKHKEMVAGMLRRPDVSPESARELLQDAYLTLGERAAGGLIPENTAAMLVTIIGLAVCNRGRRRKRRPSFDDGACTDDLPGDLPDGERRLCALECERIVHAVLARMAPPDAELIRLVDLEELSHKEAAARLGRRADLVTKQHERALRRFEALVIEHFRSQPGLDF